MSGLAEREHRKEPGEISVLIGEGQTAQVLRNLCWQLFTREDKRAWQMIVEHIQNLFNINLQAPVYIRERSELSLTYKERSGVELDLSSSGRGCQQVLLLLSFLLANPGSVFCWTNPMPTWKFCASVTFTTSSPKSPPPTDRRLSPPATPKSCCRKPLSAMWSWLSLATHTVLTPARAAK